MMEVLLGLGIGAALAQVALVGPYFWKWFGRGFRRDDRNEDDTNARSNPTCTCSCRCCLQSDLPLDQEQSNR